MAITREEKNATWTEQDAANFEQATKDILNLTKMANRHFTTAERQMLLMYTQEMKDLADLFEDAEHKPIEMVEHVNLHQLRPVGLTPDMGLSGTINTPGYNRSRLWDGTTYMSANSDDY